MSTAHGYKIRATYILVVYSANTMQYIRTAPVTTLYQRHNLHVPFVTLPSLRRMASGLRHTGACRRTRHA